MRKHQSEESNCFFLMRTDGSMEDFSVAKCLNRLFPAFAESRNSGVSTQLYLPLAWRRLPVAPRGSMMSTASKPSKWRP